MSNQFQCDHCEKPLITVAPGRFIAHGALALRVSTVESTAWIECPKCGRESRVGLYDLDEAGFMSLAVRN